jgi:Flp pilus assembly protein TadG
MEAPAMTSRSSPPTRARRRRAGALLSAELLFVLPILMMFLLAIAEYGLLALAGQRLQFAAQAGARAATLSYNDATAYEAAIKQAVEAALISPTLVAHYTLAFTPFASAQNTGDQVEVKVTAPMTAAAPDMLLVFGVSINGGTLTGRCVMRKE